MDCSIEKKNMVEDSCSYTNRFFLSVNISSTKELKDVTRMINAEATYLAVMKTRASVYHSESK